MQSIPIPAGENCLLLSGGYIEDGCFIPVDKDWMFSTTSYNPKKGITIGHGKIEAEKIEIYYMDEKGEWIDIDK